MTATLSDFAKTTFRPSTGGTERTVYRAGAGPGLVIIHEMPGLTPEVQAFAWRMVENGYTVFLPVLFGTPGKPPGGWAFARSMAQACVSREFHLWATDRASPITPWLRSLAKHAHAECGGPGVGAIGMCFTGGFALGMAVDATVVAPVLSQPSLPFPVGAKRKAAVGCSPAEMGRVAARCEAGLCVLGMRFTGDAFVPGERFETLKKRLGERFIAIEIPSPDDLHHIPKNAHSVVTKDYNDTPGHPTRVAFDRLVRFFEERLKTNPA